MPTTPILTSQALILASRQQTDDRDKIYSATKALMFFGTPHLGSSAGNRLRVQLLNMAAVAIGHGVPPELKQALTMHSRDLRDLADDFSTLSLCKDRVLKIYSFSERDTTSLLNSRVSIYNNVIRWLLLKTCV